MTKQKLKEYLYKVNYFLKMDYDGEVYTNYLTEEELQEFTHNSIVELFNIEKVWGVKPF